MKNLANCTPEEFFLQTVKIKRAAEKWLTVNEIMEIRSTPVKYPENATNEEKAEILRKQGMKNLSLIFDNVMEKHPKETMNLMAHCCFIDPEDVNNHAMKEYMAAFTEMVNDKDVIGFFGSLVRLVQMASSIA